MSDLLPTIAPYLPVALVQAITKHPDVPSLSICERTTAAVLFADVSQFSSLTERLAKESAEGPEELTHLFSQFFGTMVSLIEAEGGEVVKFGGDAVTALFAAIDEPLGHMTRRAVQAAESMQAAMSEFAGLQTRLGPVTLGLKIGIGAGEVLAIRVRGAPCRWEYLVAGRALHQALQVEAQIGPGSVRLSPEAEAVICSHELPSRAFVYPDWSTIPNLELVEDQLRCYLPRPIRGWLERGLHDWLAVLHPMSVLFLGVHGLDYDEAGTVPRLHDLFSAVVETVYRYEGTLARASVDGQGTTLFVLFGVPPFTHEDDPVRAVRCALDVCHAFGSGRADGLTMTAGVATGRVFAGPVGSAHRREYTAMGSAVNLAVRLMGGSSADGALCDYDTYRAAQSVCEFESMAPVRVKGRAGPIRVYRPTGRVSDRRDGAFALTGRREWVDWDPRTLLGREQEVTRLQSALGAVQAGDSRVLIVKGEAGIGKSRLVIELTRLARERGLTWLVGAGHSVAQETPYLAWRDVLSFYFGLDVLPRPEERQAQVQTLCWELIPDQMQYLPLLNDVMHLDLPETGLTATLDPVLRQQRLTTVVLALLKAWMRDQPLILILEDAQWLDSLSWELVTRVARTLTMAGEPMLLLLAMRPIAAHSATGRSVRALEAMAATEMLSLGALPPNETVVLATTRLGLPPQGLPDPVVSVVRRRSAGNPFYAQEVVFWLRDQGLIHILPPREGGSATRCVVSEDFHRATSALPETVQGLILARIDRLSPESQLTLKIASVIGRVFAYRTLERTLRHYTEVTDAVLKRQLSELAALDLVVLGSPSPDLACRFKHVITQDVAYQTMPFAQRRAVHRTVAETLEQLYADRIEEMVGLLAHHWDQAEQPEKATSYLLRAGERAQRAYASKEAISCFSRALELIDQIPERQLAPDHRARRRLAALRGLGQVYLGTGDLAEARRLFREAVALGRKCGLARRELVRLYHWLGEVLWWQGQRDEHMAVAEEALVLLDEDTESVEAALVNQTVATGYLGKGEWDRFREFTLRTAGFVERLPYTEELRPAFTHIVSVHLAAKETDEAMRWLGVLEDRASLHQDLRSLAEVELYAGSILTQHGTLRSGLERWKRAAELFAQLEDTKHESWCYPNMSEVSLEMGDLDQAMAYAQRALETSRSAQIADHIRLAYQDMGYIALCQGDYEEAFAAFSECARSSRAANDLVAEAWATCSLGYVCLARGDRDAALKQFKTAVLQANAQGVRPSDPRFVLALSGLERVQEPRSSRSFCQPVQARTDRSTFRQWFLQPLHEGDRVDLPPHLDGPFEQGVAGARGPVWTWHDPLGDCALDVQAGLRIRAANGRDLAGVNHSAPRAMRPAPGDVVVQVLACAAGQDRPAIGGILLWQDRTDYLLLAWGRRGDREVALEGCLEGQDVIVGRGQMPAGGAERASGHVFLRLSRMGDLVRGLCSADGRVWYRVGEARLGAKAPLEVGVCAIGAIERLVYPGAFVDGTAIRFESILLWGGQEVA